MNHLSEEDLILLFYGETEADPHFVQCGECQARSRSLAESLAPLNAWTVPEPDVEFERSAWAQLAPSLTNRPASRLRWLWLAPALAALLIAAFVLGRVTTKPRTSPVLAGLSQHARNRILLISAADHLERAGILLTEISNVTDIDPADRERAADLVQEGRLMRQLLDRSPDTGASLVIEDLERVLLDVANSNITATEVRDRIASGSLIFKANIVESNLRKEGTKS